MTTGGASHTARGYGRVLKASHQDLGQSLMSHLLFGQNFLCMMCQGKGLITNQLTYELIWNHV